MDKNEVCIATISWARNSDEETVLRHSFEKLDLLSLPVYLTDGGSSENFLRYLNSFSNFAVFESEGLWPQAKKSISEAAKTGSKFILYTEPDKEDFFVHHVSKLLEVKLDESIGVVVASRSQKGFASFPPFQQMTETTINNCCTEIIGKHIDYCYGPFLFNSKLIPYLNMLEDDCGWGWRPFVFALAHRLSLEVESLQGDFYCPPDQREDDARERIYRMKQLTQNIDGLVKAATIELC